jgi:hypothetical protein
MSKTTSVWTPELLRKTQRKPGLVVYTYNPSPEKAETGDHEFKLSLGYIVRTCLKKHLEQKFSLNSVLLPDLPILFPFPFFHGYFLWSPCKSRYAAILSFSPPSSCLR